MGLDEHGNAILNWNLSKCFETLTDRGSGWPQLQRLRPKRPELKCLTPKFLKNFSQSVSYTLMQHGLL